MPTDDYFRALKATRALHASNSKKFTGRFLLRYLGDIRALCWQHGVNSILDYGCGKAECWREPIPVFVDAAQSVWMSLAEFLGVGPPAIPGDPPAPAKVFLYDPGVPEYSVEPTGKFDLVICTQALGAIPVSDLPWVIDRLYSLAGKAVYVGERLGPVRKTVHRDMASEGLMPHGWTREQWEAALRRPDAGVPLYLRTNDRRTKEKVFGRVA